ncbi:DUF2381 family protein [Hyalangium sp.]|uniref:DUF2381 family protein n=1 Tax=Hyalangium sp. TaxID=2028555 RepID=UPI002D6C8F68|nr:DUF2381 family protein [Hyalangium sp.]HYH96211.1 DUF2381 family protein [Hyalangium sp.]
MSALSPIALLVLVITAGAANAAEALRLPDCDEAQERINLPAEPDGRVYEVCISPGLGTMIVFFGTELLSAGVTLEGAERFTVMEVGKSSLSLLPSDNVVPGERLKLTVRFVGEDAPASASFLLVAHPARATRQVEVFRQKRTLASYQQSEKEKEAQVQQCREENARLRAECGEQWGLTGLIASGLVGDDGVVPQDLTYRVTRHPTNPFAVAKVFSYRSAGLVAVVLSLEVPEGAAPWEAVGAELVGPGRRMLRVKPPWQRQPITFDVKDRRVVIEAEATEAETRGSFTLRLWDADGTRSIVLTGVTFP